MNNCFKYFLWIIIFPFFYGLATGQSYNATKQLHQTINQLSNFSIDKNYFLAKSFYRDKKGFLWIGLKNSLLKHDGVDYQEFSFHPIHEPGMLKQGPNIIFEDFNDQIWLGNWDIGISIIDIQTDSIRKIFLDEENGTKKISSILLDIDSTIWVSTPDFNLYQLDQNANILQKFHCELPQTAKDYNIKNTHFGQIQQSKTNANQLWIGSQFGLHLFNKNDHSFNFYAVDTFVVARYRVDPTPLLIDQKNQIWFGHFNKQGLKVFDISTKKWGRNYNVKSEFGLEDGSNRIMNIQMFQDSFIIAHSWWNHFYLVNINYLEDFAIEKAYAHRKNNFGFYVDPSSNEIFWGLNSEILRTTYQPNRFEAFRFGDFLSNNEKGNFQSDMIYDSSRENHYISTRHGDGVLVLDKNFERLDFVRYQSGIGFDSLDVMMYGMEKIGNSIYIGSQKGLLIFNLITNEIVHMDHTNSSDSSLLHKSISNLTYHNGLLYACLTDGGILNIELHNNNKTEQIYRPNLLINKLAFINDSLAFAASPSGLHLINITNPDQMILFTDSTSFVKLKSFEISDIEKCGDTIWLGSKGNGIISLSPDQSLQFNCQIYTSASDQGSNIINGLLVTQKREIWAATDFGISKLDKQTGTFENYGIVDGIGIAPRSAWIHEMGNGMIAMSAHKGFHFFNPNSLLNSYKPIQPYLKSLHIYNKQISTSQMHANTLRFDADDDHISFTMGAINLNTPALNKFSYKLDGYDRNWLQSKDDPIVNYTNLPSGNYEFKFRASPKGERWSNEMIKIPFEVIPVFYQTIWFQACIFFLFLLIIGFLIRHFQLKRKRKLEDLEKESQILFLQKEHAEAELTALRAQMNPHFLFNSLNSINWYILKNKPKDASQYIARFSKLIRLILEYSKSDLILLEKEIECLRLYIDLEAMRFGTDLQYELLVAKDIQITKCLVPPLVIQPFVENAIWHGLLRKKGRKKLRINIYQNEMNVCIDIQDNGIGRKNAASFSDSKPKDSKGISITKKRINKLHKDRTQEGLTFVDLQNEFGEPTGTLVQIRLPKMLKGRD